MDFQTIITIAIAVSGLVTLVDFFLWRGQRQQALSEALEKKPGLEFTKRQAILTKPEWVTTANNIFIISMLVFVVWLMLPNFELILVVALAISLLITLVEKLYLEKKQARNEKELYQRTANPPQEELDHLRKTPWWAEYGWSFFPLLLVIVVLRSFVYEPFKIPSGSMQPTLWVHDFILVNKFAYGLRLPVTKTKVTDGDAPKRGDVIVFRAPHEPTKDYIKRLVGLPGDTVYYTRNHQIFIEPACDSEQQNALAAAANLECGKPNEITQYLVEKGGFKGVDVFEESLAGVDHQIMVEASKRGEQAYYPQAHALFAQEKRLNPQLNKRLFFSKSVYASHIENWEKGVKVPEGSYFAIGDNRTGSSDSRYWGFIPEARMVGKADYVWLHLEFGFDQEGFFHWIPTGVNFDRVGAIE